MLEYFERGASNKTSFYSAGAIAPHADTQRWIYTAPTGKFAKIMNMNALVVRDGATATPAGTFSYLKITAGASVSLPVATVIVNGAVGSEVHLSNGESGVLQAGESVEGRTQDGSTGGTVRYLNSATVCEFT